MKGLIFGAVAVTMLLGTAAEAKPCRDARGKIIACKPAAKAKPAPAKAKPAEQKANAKAPAPSRGHGNGH